MKTAKGCKNISQYQFDNVNQKKRKKKKTLYMKDGNNERKKVCKGDSMKISTMILAMFVIGIVLASGVIIFFTSSEVQDIGDATSDTSSDELQQSAGEGMETTAIGIRDSLDNQMDNKYEMVKTWATSPVLVDTAKDAQDETLEDLYDMWSDEDTREYDEGEATGDGDLSNDLNPTSSEYLATLSSTTGDFPEIFITDSRGYAISANGATGDFDQGPNDWRVFLDENGLPYYKKHAPAEGGEGWYKAANDATDGFFIGEVEWDDSAETWGIDTVSQIRDPSSNEYLGQIKAVFDYGSFIEDFVKTDELDVYEIKVINQQGIIVATSETDKTKVNNEFVTVADMDFFSAVQDGQEVGWDCNKIDEDGEEVYLSWATSTDVNEHIILVTKLETDVEGPINSFVGGMKSDINDRGSQLVQQIFTISIAVCIITLSVVYVVIKKKISTPIDNLSEVSSKLSRGEIEGLEINVSGKDEISELGESFKGVLAAFNFLQEEAKQKAAAPA